MANTVEQDMDNFIKLYELKERLRRQLKQVNKEFRSRNDLVHQFLNTQNGHIF